jgi:hypothetical protein
MIFFVKLDGGKKETSEHFFVKLDGGKKKTNKFFLHYYYKIL